MSASFYLNRPSCSELYVFSEIICTDELSLSREENWTYRQGDVNVGSGLPLRSVLRDSGL